MSTADQGTFATASADAGYGYVTATLKGSAVQLTAASDSAFSLATVSAIFSDDATITGGTGSGLLPIEYTGSANGVLFPTWNYPRIPPALLPGCAFTSPNDALCYLPFTYGAPVTVDLSASFQTSFNGNVWESGDGRKQFSAKRRRRHLCGISSKAITDCT